MTSKDLSAEFYREHAQRYAQVSHQFLQSVYVTSSHPRLKNDWDALNQLKRLVPGNRGLDAGCGAGARDVFHLWSDGYDVVGVDAVEENIQVARELHPQIADRLSVADLRDLPFEDASFDFVTCNAVIQHIEPEPVRKLVLSLSKGSSKDERSNSTERGVKVFVLRPSGGASYSRHRGKPCRSWRATSPSSPAPVECAASAGPRPWS